MGPVDAIALHARLTPGSLAARDLTHGRSLSYSALDAAVSRCAGLLAETYGCGAGDRVAVLAKNRVEQIILHHACARAGLIFVPLNWRLNPGEIAVLLDDIEPKILIGDAELERVGLEGLSIDLIAAQIDTATPMPPRAIDPEQISLILFTSGTSGAPKGVMLSERALTQTAINLGVLAQVDRNSVFLVDSPMFHIIGMVSSVRPVLAQGGVVLVSDGFIPDRTLSRLSDPSLKATHYFCVPQMADRLRAEPAFEGERLKGMTAIMTGGAPHPAASINAWLAAGVPIVDGFGMSEAGTVFGMSTDPDIISAKAGSAGVPTPGVLTRLVDKQGADVGIGAPGELLLKGANLFSGYWRRPAETRSAFTPDGWFRTGDIAVRDQDGFFTIVDRKKDMFISGGENVYPAEIEALLIDFPGVIEAAVIGVPDPKWGEVGLCVLACNHPTAKVIDAVRDHLSARLARYKHPTHFQIVEALPRTGSGKVRKSDLRDAWPQL